MPAAQDPDELFDIVTCLGEPTGITKRRADVHRDGDWHRALHLWFVSEIDGERSLIFQRRTLAKDTMPGALDVTVGGHFSAGETLEDAFREAREEIGVVVTPAMAVYAGRRLGVAEPRPGLCDHEVQDLYFVRDHRPLSAYRPNPVELDGLVRVAIADLLDLLAGDRVAVPVDTLMSADLALGHSELRASDFVCLADDYWYRVAIAARAMLSGERHFSI